MDILQKFPIVYCVLSVFIVVPVLSQVPPKPTLESSQGSELGNEKTYTCSYLYSNFRVVGVRGFDKMYWYHNGQFVVFISRRQSDEILVYETYTHVNRTQISVSEDANHIKVVLTLPKLGCSDNGEYMCHIVGYLIASTDNKPRSVNVSETDVLAVTKRPSTPTLVFNPTPVVEDVPANFTCSGNVGRPAVKLILKLLKNQDDGSPVVLQSSGGQAVLDTDGCSYRTTITSTQTLTRAHKGAYVSCMVENQDMYKHKVAVTIEYLVQSTAISFDGQSQTANNSIHTVGDGSQYQLSCQADAAPLATFQVWHIKNDQNTELLVGRLPLLRRATKSHAGQYYCEATNILTNKHNSTVMSNVFTLKISDRTTTVSTSTASTTKQPGGSTGKTTDDTSSANTGAIAGGVVAGLVVVVVVVVVLIIFCRNKKPRKFPNSQNSNVKPANNLGSGSLYKESEPDLYKSHKQPSTPGNHNPGYNRQDDYLNHIPMSSEGRSRNPVVLNESPYAYTSPYPDSLASQYSHSRPV